MRTTLPTYFIGDLFEFGLQLVKESNPSNREKGGRLAGFPSAFRMRK